MNSSQSDSLGPVVLPVSIPSVLNKILSYLPHPNLKIFRNVSSQWAEEGWKHMRKDAVMKVQMANLARLEEIHSYFLSNKSCICTNIKFQDFSWILVSSSIFMQFATEYGSLIKHVHLDESTYNADEPELQSKLFSLFPNLEELVLSFQEPDMDIFISTSRSFVAVANENGVDKHPFKLENLKSLKLNRIFRKEDGRFVMKILKCAPNLQTISISESLVNAHLLKTFSGPFNAYARGAFVHQDFQDNEPFLNRRGRPLQDYRTLRRVGNFATYNELFSHYFLNENNIYLNNLLHFNFHMLITNDTQLQTLRYRQCTSLKTLHLVLNPNLNTDEIRSLLSCFSKTLESLYLSLNTTESNFSQRCRYYQIWDMSVEWEKLDLLCLKNIQCFSIPLASNMPNLKTVLLHGCSFFNSVMKEDEKEQRICVPDDHSQDTLQTLVVHCDKSKKLTTQVLLTIKTRFPNLKKLKLENLTDSGLRVIFSDLCLLEDLFIESDRVSDSGITGLRPEVCRKLMKMQTNSLLTFKKSYASLKDLQRLRKLEIASSNISDVSILYGIAECLSLRKLFLYSPKISSKSVRKIVNDMHLAVLELEFCQQLPDVVVQWAKKTFPDPANIEINSRGPKTAVQIAQYFKTRGATFHFRD